MLKKTIIFLLLITVGIWSKVLINEVQPQKAAVEGVSSSVVETVIPTQSIDVKELVTIAPTSSPTPIATYAPPTFTPTPTIVNTINQQGQGLSNDNYYTNTSGNQVHSPAYSNSVPAGATAICGDGTYSFSESRRGTCSHHGGVSQWL